MSFRFYIVGLSDDYLRGTNDEETALEFSDNDEYLVIDQEKDEWITQSRDRLPIVDAASKN